MIQLDELQRNIENVRLAIEEVTSRAGRKFDVVRVIAATKTQPIEVVEMLANNPIISTVGENRVQELRDKYCPIEGLDWHFIGQLQTNKVKYLIGKVAMIHSVDRRELVDEISRLAMREGIVQDVLAEVNVTDDVNRGGVQIDGIRDLIAYISDAEGIRLRGIMTVLPTQESLRGEAMLTMQRLFDTYAGGEFDTLSMGMSEDYLSAIEHGSNMVRLGRALFGARQ